MTRASAIAAPKRVKSRELYAAARQQLIDAAATDEHAKFLLIESYQFGGWGVADIYNYKPETPKAGSGMERLTMLRDNPYAWDEQSVIKDAIAGDPIPFYVAVYDMDSLPPDVKCALVALGLFNVATDIPMMDRHRYISGMFTYVIDKWVRMDPINLIYVFRNYRHELSHVLIRFYLNVINHRVANAFILNMVNYMSKSRKS